MGNIFFPKWSDKVPPKLRRKRRMKILGYWYLGYGYYILQFADGTKELISKYVPERLLFDKADGYDDYGKPIYTH